MLDTRDVTHLRYLCDSLHNRPDMSGELIDIVLSVIDDGGQRDLVRVLEFMKSEFQNHSYSNITERMVRSTDPSMRRAGEIMAEPMRRGRVR